MEKQPGVKTAPAKKEIVLQMLTQANDFISGEELSEKLNVSRTAIWKIIHGLLDEGYTIERVTNKGYRLLGAPDLISTATLAPFLRTKILGHTLYTYQTIDSTNTEAKRCSMQGAVHGSVFVSEEQTGGKGRLGRKWISPPGAGLWFTLLLRPDCPPTEAANMTLVSGLAVCRAIRNLYGLDARIKWPNDIVLGSKKLSGMLLEMSTEENQVDYVLAGIGVNANTGSFPEEIAYKATSLQLACGHDIRRAELLAAILNEFEPLLELHQTHQTQRIMQDYRELCVSIGRQVSAQRPDGLLTGIAVDITESGELVIRTPEGKDEIIFSGEVSVQGIYDQPPTA